MCVGQMFVSRYDKTVIAMIVKADYYNLALDETSVDVLLSTGVRPMVYSVRAFDREFAKL